MGRAERLLLSIGFVAALAIRLAFFAGFSGNYDTASYEEVARAVRAGADPWSTERYNYSPVWAGVLVGLRHVAGAAGVSLATAVGALLLAADAATALLLAKLGGGGRTGARAALLFFANPVSILVSTHHRAFDGLALLLLLAALLAFRREPPATGRVAAALAGSLLVKHVAAFQPLLFLRTHRRRGLSPAVVAAVYAVFAASFLPFVSAWPAIRRNVLLYGGLGGLYGTDAILLVPGVPFWVPRVLFLLAALAAVFVLLRRGVETARASLLLFLVTLVFLPGIGRQYFVWPIALGALFPGVGYAIYTVVATAALVAIAGLAPSLAHLPGWYGVWWAALLWLLLEARRGAAREAV